MSHFDIEHLQILDNLACPVAILDFDLHLHYANQAFADKMGKLPKNGHLGNLLDNTRAVGRSLEAARQMSGNVPMRLETTNADEALLGMVRCLQIGAADLFLFQVSQTDTSRFFKLNRELESLSSAYARERRMSTEHESTYRAIEAFVETLVHDIRSPLATVVQGMELLPDEIEANNLDLCRALTTQLRASSERLVEFVDSLYQHSQVHRAKLSLESVDLERIVQALTEDLSVHLHEAGGQVVIDTPLPIIQADRQMLRQLLQNLMQNSMKFRSPKRPLVIRIACQRIDNSKLELSIEDNGRGIAPEKINELFVPYRRGDSDGLGIGLATCRSISEKHDWMIRGEGAIDRGAKFTLTITSWC